MLRDGAYILFCNAILMMGINTAEVYWLLVKVARFFKSLRYKDPIVCMVSFNTTVIAGC